MNNNPDNFTCAVIDCDTPPAGNAVYPMDGGLYVAFPLCDDHVVVLGEAAGLLEGADEPPTTE